MMKHALMALIGALMMCTSAAPGAQLKIVTTTTDYADLARQIGGDKVDVHSVMRGPESIHNLIAKPTEMLQLNKADMFVHGGLDAEPWRDNLIKGARNPKILPGEPGNVDMSIGIDLLDVPTGKIDRSMGDVHAFGNPHFSTDPRNGQRMTVTLVNAMCEVDPANAELYKANAKKLVLDLASVYEQLKEEFEPYAGLKVVTFHKSWDYFANAFDIDIVTTIEPKPLITPSPGEMKAVIDTMKGQDVRIVIVETWSSYDQAKRVADAAPPPPGAQLLVLPDHVDGKPEADSYQNLFRSNIRKLIEAAKAAGIEPKPSTSTPTSPANSAEESEPR
jgi:zinc/manganese transport system substrate-binding protein